jgi:hypothetical protein
VTAVIFARAVQNPKPRIPLNADLYIFSISRAQDADEIRSLVEDATADESLNTVEREEIGAAAEKQFSKLNAEAIGPQRGRWEA